MSDFKPAADTLAHATEQREQYALTVFDYGKVHADILAAATTGRNYLRIAQEQPLDLSSSNAASNLIKKLKAGKYRCTWEPMRIREKSGNAESGYLLEYPELCIEWGPVKREAGPIAMAAD